MSKVRTQTVKERKLNDERNANGTVAPLLDFPKCVRHCNYRDVGCDYAGMVGDGGATEGEMKVLREFFPPNFKANTNQNQ